MRLDKRLGLRFIWRNKAKKHQNAKPLKGFSIRLARAISLTICLALPPSENFFHKINMSIVWSRSKKY
jgi:hypothetical protein